MKHEVIAMKKHGGFVTIGGGNKPLRMKLPEGCTGVLFVFESKKAARAYWGNNVPMERVKEIRKEPIDK